MSWRFVQKMKTGRKPKRCANNVCDTVIKIFAYKFVFYYTAIA